MNEATMSANPTEPRSAATLLIVRDQPFEVLMVRRHSGGTFHSALVFPGGAVDPQDSAAHWPGNTRGGHSLSAEDRAFRIAAARETWEEAGLLVGVDGAPDNPDPSIPYPELVGATHTGLDLDQLHDFAHWVTPATEKRRFDTRFFLARAPHGQQARFDGRETVSMQWTSPSRALQLHESGEVPLLFPTRLNLERLAESDTVDSAISAAQSRPRYVVEPVIEIRAGAITVRIPADAGYSQTSDFRGPSD